jgi:hypothetical protein
MLGEFSALESLQRLAVARQIIGEKLQGDKAAQLGVLGFEGNTHLPAAKLLQNSIVRDVRSGHAVVI